MSYSNPAAYERFMGRWSARLAPSFLRFAEVRDGQHVLDVGCGTGNLSRALVSLGPTITVAGLDRATEYLTFAQEAAAHPRARFQLGAAESIPFPDAKFDAALALLVLQDFTNARQAVSEMTRVTQPGGVVAACLWDFQDGLPMLSLLWQAAEAVAPDAVLRNRSQNLRPPHATSSDLVSLWRRCGLCDIKTATLELPMEFSSFEEYWQPFLGKSTPTSGFAAALNQQTDCALARDLRQKIPGVEADGSFVLPARAFAIKGIAPSGSAD